MLVCKQKAPRDGRVDQEDLCRCVSNCRKLGRGMVADCFQRTPKAPNDTVRKFFESSFFAGHVSPLSPLSTPR